MVVPGAIKGDGFDLTTLSEERLELFIVEECKRREITNLTEERERKNIIIIFISRSNGLPLKTVT